MAQLALTLAGSVLGGTVAGRLGQPLGSLFGAYLGGILDRELLGPQEDRRTVEGARIAEFNLSGSAYGQTIPMIFGRMRVPANVIWVRGIRKVALAQNRNGWSVELDVSTSSLAPRLPSTFACCELRSRRA